ncbi:MAG: nucleotidyltransferase family protein [Rhizobiales bacterium]|nr:nucleotidyltransferase family protein [Hyphomicrobiales bacterium]
MSLAAAVLAAGTSSRMGRNKMLLELNGEPLVRRAVRTVLEAGFLEVTVVVGREPELIAAALEGLPCRFAFNPDFATQGMEASLRTAVTNIPEDSSGLLFTLADQVFVTSSLLRTLIESRGGALVTASRFGDGDRATAPVLEGVVRGAGDTGERCETTDSKTPRARRVRGSTP